MSFTDTLYDEKTREDIFVEYSMNHFRNLKWLRYRTKYAKLTIMERLIAYEQLGYALDQAAMLLYKVSRKSGTLRHKTQEDFVHDVVTQWSDAGLAEEITRRALLEHHDNVSGKITGMFLAYEDILKKHKSETSKLLKALETSGNAIKRLNHAI